MNEQELRERKMEEKNARVKKVRKARLILAAIVVVVIVIVIAAVSCGKKDETSKESAKATKAKVTTVKEITTAKPKPRKTVIVGECYVEDFEKYCKDLLPKGTEYIYKIGVLTGALLEDPFINEGGQSITAIEKAAMYKPDQVFFLCGMNETENDTPQITVKHYEKMKKALQSVNKNVKMILVSLPPVAKDGLEGYGTNAQIRNYNEALKKYADKTENVYYYDIRPLLEDENGRLKKEANPGDGAHWNVSSTKEVAKAIKKYSDELSTK
ncbi:MAG: hypothetical protein K6E58_04940 [Eubacterium sp.]|nr:hypothetical protein [Eubacterium sp.]